MEQQQTQLLGSYSLEVWHRIHNCAEAAAGVTDDEQ
jgi:hypothetical protein